MFASFVVTYAKVVGMCSFKAQKLTTDPALQNCRISFWNGVIFKNMHMLTYYSCFNVKFKCSKTLALSAKEMGARYTYAQIYSCADEPRGFFTKWRNVRT